LWPKKNIAVAVFNLLFLKDLRRMAKYSIRELEQLSGIKAHIIRIVRQSLILAIDAS